MTDPIKPGNPEGHGDFERLDIGPRGVIYFLVGIGLATLLIHFLLAGLYDALDKHERGAQPAVNPLVINVPADTRKVAPKYPEKAFPEPRLETDERTQLDEIRIQEEDKLNSYGWADEKAGTVTIPIERAMDLLAERGLPVHSQNASSPAASQSASTTASAAAENQASKKSGKKK